MLLDPYRMCLLDPATCVDLQGFIRSSLREQMPSATFPVLFLSLLALRTANSASYRLEKVTVDGDLEEGFRLMTCTEVASYLVSALQQGHVSHGF